MEDSGRQDGGLNDPDARTAPMTWSDALKKKKKNTID